MSYFYRGNKHTAEINGKLIAFDSNLEEKVVRMLVSQGYAEHWLRPEEGARDRTFNYTPDLELSVEENGRTHRALVEVKPAVAYMTPDITRRMVGASRYYFTEMLLVYADKEKAWFRIDLRTLQLRPTLLPPPGKLPIDKLSTSWSIGAKPIYAHKYRKRVEWEKWPLLVLGGVLQGIAVIIGGLNRPPKSNTRYTRSRKKR